MTTPLPPDMPVRPGFWNVPLWGEIGVYVVGLAAVALCVWGIVRGMKATREGALGDPSTKTEKDPQALKRTLRAVLFADRIRETAFGNVHAALVVGFFFLFLGTALATLDWDIGHYVFGTQFLRGNVYLAYKLILDVAGVAVLAALLIGFVRRMKSATLPRTDRFLWAYASLAFIVLSGYVVEGLRLAVEQPLWMSFSPVGSVVAKMFLAFGIERSGLESVHVLLWTVHGLAALAFIATIPLTFYGHMYRTPLSIFHRKAAPLGRLPKIEAIEEQETFGLSRIEQLSASERFQLEGCVECGRCNDVCPAVRAGTPLEPRTIVMKLRERAERLAAGLPDDGKSLTGDVVTHEELFSCTTCGACARACPAEIQTPDLIVRMRRHLALEEGAFPEGAATALENTASVGNPWGLDPYERLDWGKDLDLPVAEPGEHYDVLYWVGCAASYDRRARKVARAVVTILRAAGVKFAVMSEERCHGEFARRLGEEYLFQTAAQENIENFANYAFDRILTACPHCFNTLANEYPTFEGFPEVPVVDHATFIRELIDAGRLAGVSPDATATVYHDPCYLARLNGVTEAPRSVLDAATRPLYPEETGEKTLCCGAGGGQMWAETKNPKPVNIVRLEDLKKTGARRVAVACPHCLTMLESAKATTGDEETFVRDIAEIVAERLTEAKETKGEKSEEAEAKAEV